MQADRRALAILASASGVLLAGAAGAEPWEGRWGANGRACRLGQDAGEQAPIRLGRKEFVFNEGVCTVRSIRERGPAAWTVATACRLEGEAERRVFTLAVTTAGTLRLSDGRAASSYVRCPGR